MYDAIETFQVANLMVEIHHDPDPFNPREEYDNLGTMACWHRHYRLGDEQPTCSPDDYLMNPLSEEAQNRVGRCDRLIDEVPCFLGEDYRWHPAPKYAQRYARLHSIRRATIEADLERNYVILPLWLYDHGGILMRTSAVSCGWDSGQVGIIHMSMEQARKEWSGSDKEIRAKAREYLTGEVEEYSMAISGQVYGYTISGEDGEVIDSCRGFLGWESVMEGARDAAEHFVSTIPRQLELEI